MMRSASRRRLLALAVVGLLIAALPHLADSADVDSDGDGLPNETEKWLGSPSDRAQEWVTVWSREEKEAVGNPGPQALRLSAAHVAEDRYLWKIDFAKPLPAAEASVLLYVDADNRPDTGRQDKPEVRGTDLMYVLSGPKKTVSAHGNAANEVQSAIRIETFDRSVVMCHDARLNQADGKAALRVRLLAQQDNTGGSSSDWVDVRIALVNGQKKPRLLGPGDPEYLGLTGDEVRKSMSGPYPKRRSMPRVPFTSKSRCPGKAGTTKRERVAAELAEEMGVACVGAPVTFGLPLKQGALFDPSHVRLLDPKGNEVPAQFTITGFWKDGSIRWLAVTFLTDLAPKTKPVYTVEFGSEVRRKEPTQTVQVKENDKAVLVNTGPMQVQLGRGAPGILQGVWIDRNGDGKFTDDETVIARTSPEQENGETYKTSDSSVRIEEAGPSSVLVRMEGPYTNPDRRPYFRYVMWLRFYAGSSVVDVAHRHVDDSLDREFADFRSLVAPLRLAFRASSASVLLPDKDGKLIPRTIPLKEGSDVRLFQRDDTAFRLTGPSPCEGRRAPGVIAVQEATGRGIGVAMEDFWQNYPGALRASADRLDIELWPDISGEAGYAELPDYLRFPFVGGGYRFKWGMSKTHRFRLNLGLKPGEGMAPAEPIVAVLPSEYYEKTKALGPMAARRKGEFAAWDEAMERCLKSHIEIKENVREYGFFNWGDWYGERGTNWGNNEYDLPHALFMQFARTGNRDYFRLAVAGARHQADVDCIHAYPDPAYLGGNVLHSVFHTGEWSQHIADRSWSFAYSYHAMAFNGHTWAEGMCEAWHLAADAPVMESAQALGEHVVYGMVPRFDKLGTHERSAGWSLVAVMAIYRSTLDPLYLDAAKKIAEVAFRERKPGQGSGWPHKLPGDHCRHSQVPGAEICTGNVAFLIGVLCSGLKEYYLESGDEHAKEAVLGVGPWWKEMWDPDGGTFQYTSCPLFRGSTSPLTAMLCADAVAFTYEQTQDIAFANMAAESLISNMASPPGGQGKGFAMFARSAPPVMAFLRTVKDKSESARVAVSATADDLLLRRLRAGRPVEFFGIRSPEVKKFFVRFDGGKPDSITVERRPHGAMNKAKPTGTVTITDPNGKAVRSETFDTDLPYLLKVDLSANAPKGVYRVEIHDDMRGIWHVASTGGKVVMDCSETPSLGNYRTHRLFFFVPTGVQKFRLGISPAHGGGFGLCVFDPAGNPRGHVTGTKIGKETPEGLVDVQVPQGQGGKAWSMVLFAGTDLRLKMEGIPPRVSRSVDGWFDPGRP